MWRIPWLWACKHRDFTMHICFTFLQESLEDREAFQILFSAQRIAKTRLKKSKVVQNKWVFELLSLVNIFVYRYFQKVHSYICFYLYLSSVNGNAIAVYPVVCSTDLQINRIPWNHACSLHLAGQFPFFFLLCSFFVLLYPLAPCHMLKPEIKKGSCWPRGPMHFCFEILETNSCKKQARSDYQRKEIVVSNRAYSTRKDLWRAKLELCKRFEKRSLAYSAL